MHIFADAIGMGSGTGLAQQAGEAIHILHTVLEAGSWAIAGETAMRYYRQELSLTVCLGIEIIVTPNQLKAIHRHFPCLEYTAYGCSAYHNGVFIDFYMTLHGLYRNALNNAKTVPFAEGAIPVIPLAHLLPCQLMQCSESGLHPLKWLCQLHPGDLLKARILCKQHLPNAIEDFDSLLLAARDML